MSTLLRKDKLLSVSCDLKFAKLSVTVTRLLQSAALHLCNAPLFNQDSKERECGGLSTNTCLFAVYFAMCPWESIFA